MKRATSPKKMTPMWSKASPSQTIFDSKLNSPDRKGMDADSEAGAQSEASERNDSRNHTESQHNEGESSPRMRLIAQAIAH